MGSYKLVVFFCLAVIATSTQASSPRTFSEAKLNDIFDEATKLLENLSQTVTGVVQSSLDQVQGLVDQLDAASQNVISELTTSLDGVTKGLVDNINNLVKDAEAKGLDPAACVGTSLNDLQALPSSSITKASDCVSSKVQETNKVINKKILEITSVLDDITKIEKAINKCRKQSFLIQPICITQVTTDIASKVISLPNKVTSAVTSIAKIVPKNIAGLAQCEVGVVEEVTTKGTAIVQTVTDCIGNL